MDAPRLTEPTVNHDSKCTDVNSFDDTKVDVEARTDVNRDGTNLPTAMYRYQLITPGSKSLP